MSAWKLQFERMLRCLKKLEQPSGNKNEELDNAYGFFQNSWHLKDWIKNDDALPQTTRDSIAREAESSDSLQFCADLANGSKHLKLSRHIRKGATLWHATIAVKDLSGQTLSEAGGWAVASKHGSPSPSDVVGFARKVVQDWTVILTKHGLK